MLNVIVLSVVMPGVVMLSVVAPAQVMILRNDYILEGSYSQHFIFFVITNVPNKLECYISPG